MIPEEVRPKKRNKNIRKKKISRHQIISGVVVNTVQDQCVG